MSDNKYRAKNCRYTSEYFTKYCENNDSNNKLFALNKNVIKNGDFSTPVDIKVFPHKYQYIVDVPGDKKKNYGELKVTVEENNELVISGRRRIIAEEEKGVVTYLQKKRDVGDFSNRFQLPFDANKDAITADHNTNLGLLIVTVKKFAAYGDGKPKVVQNR